MDIRINLIHYPLYVLGPNRRIGIWVQGCSLGCKGCISQHTWDKEGGVLYGVERLVKEVLESDTKRVTITGGEPFEQAIALKELLIGLRDSGIDDILLYSGFSYRHLQQKFQDILKFIDVLVVGQFKIDQPTEFAYKGSDNQEMIVLNQNLKEEYLAYQKKRDRELQVINSNGIFVLGIPQIGKQINEKI